MAVERLARRERAIVVGVAVGRMRTWLAQEHLNELCRLAETAEAEVIATFMQRLESYNPSTLIGAGKVAEIAALMDGLTENATEQAGTLRTIDSSAQNIQGITQHNAAATEEVSAVTRKVVEVTREVVGQLSGFTLTETARIVAKRARAA